jgi:hypothetical protein
MAVQMDLFEMKRASERIELPDVPINVEQFRVCYPVRPARSELIVENNRAVIPKDPEGLEVVACITRAPVKQE